ncbi:MAG: tellurite resistance TerB family protein [Oscillatoriaceae bacterium SKW80]|nr:tellurite resistance TerB family protein [Oscillatoriaceae bacterium SKYG93]MCX8120617.1 tellurite resistance TerB family protein [Oscillatoriaceae bacterium SKW80]MDW8453844.1 tellurite resistance TerB family protein [Oscillatoriaceae cyanobacterium SKYGB_i_bin93]HIK27075.1 tellurite resistance TerB family protein [Oscillatoriaceae cyanobacterium M7585_C2015_266]
MSKFDHIFKTYAKYAEKLTPLEALFAITLIVVYADGKRAAKEDELLRRLIASGAMKGFSEKDFQKISEKIDKIWDEQGTAALFNAAISALPKDMLEEAYGVAVAFAIADGKVSKKESNYLDELAQAMGLSEETAHKIVTETWLNYRISDFNN